MIRQEFLSADPKHRQRKGHTVPLRVSDKTDKKAAISISADKVFSVWIIEVYLL